MSIFNSFDFSHLQSEAAWFVIIYSTVLGAMFVDFITGIQRAKAAGILRTSRGFRRTAEKAQQYLLPMFCLTLIDIIASAFLDYPYLTALLAIFNIYIEIKSVWENTHTAEETAQQKECAEDLIKFVLDHKEEFQKLLKQ